MHNSHLVCLQMDYNKLTVIRVLSIITVNLLFFAIPLPKRRLRAGYKIGININVFFRKVVR